MQDARKHRQKESLSAANDADLDSEELEWQSRPIDEE